MLGCSGSVSGPASPASAYLVQAPYRGRTFTLLLDLGPGAFGALWASLDPREVDAIGLSHLHPDHCLDLCGFFVAARYGPTAPWPRRWLYGPRGTLDRLTRAYQVTADEPGPGMAEQFDVRSWEPSQQIGPFTVRTARVAHPVEAYAIRVEQTDAGVGLLPTSGPCLVYSGDTGPCPALVALARGADLLLIEAAFDDRPDNPPGMHLSGRQAAQIGAAAGVHQVLLTHIPPWRDPTAILAEAIPDFPGLVSLAVPGGRWPLTSTAAAP